MQKVKAKELSIVMIGLFNPAIINPHWLVSKGFISDLEIKKIIESDKDSYITHSQVSHFKLPYCNVQTLQGQYHINSMHEGYFDQANELTKAIFSLLKETPIWQLGINITHHYEFNTDQEWHKFNSLFSPKEIWNLVVKNPILKRMEIKSQREDGFNGEVNINIGMSEMFDRGIKVQVNDHYNLYTPEELRINKNINALKCLEILENLNEKMGNASKKIDGVIDHASKLIIAQK